MNFIEITFETDNEEIQELIISQLNEIGYNGFEQEKTCLKAFINEVEFDENKINELLASLQLKYSKQIIQHQNWNELWESNFQPVCVDDFVGVRAHFHASLKNVKHEIIITPKMSFGTGHHATTFMVMQLMQEIDFYNKSVFDFGTGTGILAILTEKLGATKILAVDNDEWCIENSLENISQNNCSQITIQKSTNAFVTNQFDVVIANINKNIIIDNFSLLNAACKKSGTIILSGLLFEDETDIVLLAETYNWKHIKTAKKDQWIAILFKL